MQYDEFLGGFQEVLDKLDKRSLVQKQIEAAVGEVLKSVFLKLYKKSWANPAPDPLHADSRIFFSVWISDLAIKEKKVFYNIHALKLRKLEGYSIQSRKFAEIFRDGFKRFEDKWENVRTDLGPLTLMEGWIKLDLETFQDDVLQLANGFLAIEHLIDDTLEKFK